jgi:hypothetical protein
MDTNEVLQYYLTGGKLKLGKKEATLELLRQDSVIRRLLGFSGGELKTLVSKSTQTEQNGEFVIFDFTGIAERHLEGDPSEMLQELKKRYGSMVGGTLYFKMMYTTFEQVYYSRANLDADEVSLKG